MTDNKTRVVNYAGDIAEVFAEVVKLQKRVEALEQAEYFRKYNTYGPIAYVDNSFPKLFDSFQLPKMESK